MHNWGGTEKSSLEESNIQAGIGCIEGGHGQGFLSYPGPDPGQTLKYYQFKCVWEDVFERVYFSIGYRLYALKEDTGKGFHILVRTWANSEIVKCVYEQSFALEDPVACSLCAQRRKNPTKWSSRDTWCVLMIQDTAEYYYWELSGLFNKLMSSEKANYSTTLKENSKYQFVLNPPISNRRNLPGE